MKPEIEFMHCDDSRKHVITDYLLAIRILRPVIECFPMHKNDYSICSSIFYKHFEMLSTKLNKY